MYARSTSIQGRPAWMDEAIGYLRDEVAPLLTRLPGCVGLSMIVERDAGLCIVTSAWTTVDAMRASDVTMAGVRTRAITILDGTSPIVDEWEIAVLHRRGRAGEDARLRATWLDADPAVLDEVADGFRSQVLARLEPIDGFRSASLLVNRDTGRAVASCCFETPAALAAGVEEADRALVAGTRRAGAQILELRDFELAHAHFHAPELA